MPAQDIHLLEPDDFMHHAPPDRLLTLEQVMDLVALSKSKIYDLIGKGGFPIPCKPGRGASRWSQCEIHQWIDQQKANRESLIDG